MLFYTVVQVMKKALRDPDDPTKFFLVYANQTPADILLRQDLDAWAKEFPERVKIWFTVDRCCAACFVFFFSLRVIGREPLPLYKSCVCPCA